jgi:hypothetical protein
MIIFLDAAPVAPSKRIAATSTPSTLGTRARRHHGWHRRQRRKGRWSWRSTLGGGIWPWGAPRERRERLGNSYHCNSCIILVFSPETLLMHEALPFGSMESHLFGEFFSQVRLVVWSSSSICNAVRHEVDNLICLLKCFCCSCDSPSYK